MEPGLQQREGNPGSNADYRFFLSDNNRYLIEDVDHVLWFYCKDNDITRARCLAVGFRSNVPVRLAKIVPAVCPRLRHDNTCLAERRNSLDKGLRHIAAPDKCYHVPLLSPKIAVPI